MGAAGSIEGAAEATTKESFVTRAKFSEQAERYDDMYEEMKKVVEMTEGDLQVEERNLMSVAAKNKIGSRRSAWRALDQIRQEDSLDAEGDKAILEEKITTVAKEILVICTEIIDGIDKHMVQCKADGKSMPPESEVFCLKMSGDYNRYIAEIFTDQPEAEKAKAKANESYTQAAEITLNKLEQTNPVGLGLALNRSVFHYEIMKDDAEACKIAKQAFDNAVSKLDDLSESHYKDATLIMQLLRDNLTLWTSSNDDEEGKE